MSLGLTPGYLPAAEEDLAAHLLQRYYAFIEATTNGNLEMAEQVLSARNIQATRNALANSGRMLSPESFKLSRPRSQFSIDNVEFVIVNGPTAGLAMKSIDTPPEVILNDSPETEAAEFLFVRFVLENGAWKHDGAVSRYASNLTEQGQETTFDRSWINGELAIDGIVRPTPEPVPVVDPDLVGTISNSCSSCQLEIELNGIVQDFSVPFVEGGLNNGENTLILSLTKPSDSAGMSGRLSVRRLVQDGQFVSAATVFETSIGELGSGTYEFTFELNVNQDQ